MATKSSSIQTKRKQKSATTAAIARSRRKQLSKIKPNGATGAKHH